MFAPSLVPMVTMVTTITASPGQLPAVHLGHGGAGGPGAPRAELPRVRVVGDPVTCLGSQSGLVCCAWNCTNIISLGEKIGLDKLFTVQHPPILLQGVPKDWVQN